MRDIALEFTKKINDYFRGVVKMMKYVIALGLVSCMFACSGSQKGHFVSTKKPIYHHTWYKNSRWHNKLQVGRVRLRLFEKQGVKTVKMRG